MLETEAYITIKDQKEGFPNNLSFRLLNPSKSDIGKISKNILDQINKSLIAFTHANQWKNTSSVIGWFKNISNKRQSSFIQFDVENFYPSISLTLFNNAIQYACEITEITNHDISIINTLEKLYSSIATSHGKTNLVIQILTSQWVVMMEQKFAN